MATIAVVAQSKIGSVKVPDVRTADRLTIARMVYGCSHCPGLETQLETLHISYHSYFVEDHADLVEKRKFRSGIYVVEYGVRPYDEPS